MYYKAMDIHFIFDGIVIVRKLPRTSSIASAGIIIIAGGSSSTQEMNWTI